MTPSPLPLSAADAVQRLEQCASCHVRANGRLHGNAAAQQHSPSGQRSWSHGFDIPEENWQDAVQIIGWLYQYYNTELKDDTFAQLKKNVKITKERIPAATQLFTPDWIVRYMVENSLGRLWLEGHHNAELRGGWKYYLDEAEQEPEVEPSLPNSVRNTRPSSRKRSRSSTPAWAAVISLSMPSMC